MAENDTGVSGPTDEKDRTFRTYAEKRARSASDEERQAVEVFSLAAWRERQQAIPPNQPAENWNPNTAGPDCDWCGECSWCDNLGRAIPPANRCGWDLCGEPSHRAIPPEKS